MSSGTPPPSILCLGPEGSGKTLLLRRLQTNNVDGVTCVVETVGSNIVSILRRLPKDPQGAKAEVPGQSGGNRKGFVPTPIPEQGWRSRDIVDIRELGGSMAAIWPNYYPQAKLVLYVIDSSNLFQVSISTVLLMNLLPHELLTEARFLIVLAKKDCTELRQLNYLKYLLRLDDLVKQVGKSRLSVVQASSISGEGIEEIREWIDKNLPRDQKLKTYIKST